MRLDVLDGDEIGTGAVEKRGGDGRGAVRPDQATDERVSGLGGVVQDEAGRPVGKGFGDFRRRRDHGLPPVKYAVRRVGADVTGTNLSSMSSPPQTASPPGNPCRNANATPTSSAPGRSRPARSASVQAVRISRSNPRAVSDPF